MRERDYAPISERPRIARILIANWRLNAMCRGEELSVSVVPGEWPDDAPNEIAGVPISQDPDSLVSGQPGFMVAFGRLDGRSEWRAAFFGAFEPVVGMSRADQALVTIFARVTDKDDPVLVEVGDVFSVGLK